MGGRVYIQRSLRETIRAVVTSVVCLSLGVYLIVYQYQSLFPLFLSAFLVPLGCYSLFQAYSSSSVAPCPSCGHEIAELARNNEGVLCRHCDNFLEGSDGWLEVTSPDRIAGKHLFGAPLGKSWPNECCVCGGTATTSNHAVTDFKAGKYAPTQSITVDVPYCNQHRHGAYLRLRPSPQIFFRSLKYLRAYCAANQSRPVEVNRRG
jgi:hypothetical protein